MRLVNGLKVTWRGSFRLLAIWLRFRGEANLFKLPPRAVRGQNLHVRWATGTNKGPPLRCSLWHHGAGFYGPFNTSTVWCVRADEKHQQMTRRTCFYSFHKGVLSRDCFLDPLSRVRDKIAAPATTGSSVAAMFGRNSYRLSSKLQQVAGLCHSERDKTMSLKMFKPVKATGDPCSDFSECCRCHRDFLAAKWCKNTSRVHVSNEQRGMSSALLSFKAVSFTAYESPVLMLPLQKTFYNTLNTFFLMEDIMVGLHKVIKSNSKLLSFHFY